MCKSSLLVFSSWLGHAMEGPTTVSSLLHSSTMVLAGLLLMLGVDVSLSFCVGCLALVGFLVAFYRRSNRDYKRTMANSTSSQLNFIGVIVICVSSLAAVFYMLNHARFKARFFMVVGIVIHFTGVMKSSVGLGINKILSGFSFSFIGFMARLFRFSVACVPKDLLILSCTDLQSRVLLRVALGSYVYGKALIVSEDSSLSLSSVLHCVLIVAIIMAGGYRGFEGLLARHSVLKLVIGHLLGFIILRGLLYWLRDWICKWTGGLCNRMRKLWVKLKKFFGWD